MSTFPAPRRYRPGVASCVFALTLWSASVDAVVVPRDKDPELAPLVVSQPRLHPTRQLDAIDTVDAELATPRRAAWDTFSLGQRPRGSWTARVDRRSGLIEIAEGAGVPWVPGYGNDLELSDLAAHLRGRAKVDLEALESLARSFLSGVAPLLGTEGRLLRLDRGVSGPYSDYLWIVEFDVYTADDLQIENARVFFRVNNGNLIQFGAERLPDPAVEAPRPVLDRDQAFAVVEQYVGGVTHAKEGGKDWFYDLGTLKALPVTHGGADAPFAFGAGYELLPVWEFAFRREGGAETWRVRVDAASGDVVEFVDTNKYSQVTGGYWPVSWKVNGTTVNQVSTGWPFTSINPLGATSNTSGLYAWDGNPQTAYHTGPYVTITDSCAGGAGTAASDASGNIDFGTFNPTGPTDPGDCTNALGIGDNTPAARQQYWHVNKIKEKARTFFPTNTWLQQQLGVNVNINLTCNAFWNGSTLNFYRTNGSCYNLGANAGVSMHEWGHGMDSNDGNGSSIDNGTGETYGDFSGSLQTLNSCLGNGIFTSGVCGGYGNPCVAGGCDGIRDIDWGRHTNNAPMTVASFTEPLCPSDGGGGYNGPCGDGASQPDDKEGHCESLVSSSALWDLAAAYPAEATDGTLLVDQNDGLGVKGTTTHGSLTNDTTYYYSAFVDNGVSEYSARRTVSARPFDTSGNVTWAYSSGASALAPPGIGSVYGVANDRVLHSMDTTGGGTWPATWTPLAMNAPAQGRPPIVPIPLAGATKVAFLGSQDQRVYAVDADTGAALWSSADLGAMVQAAPAGTFSAFIPGAPDLILVGTRNGAGGSEFHALNLATGTIAWTFTNSLAQGGDGSALGIIASAASVDVLADRLYFASRRRTGGSSNTVWCLSFTGASVTLDWARDLGDVDGSPILVGSKLYVGTNSGEVHALDTANGNSLWAAPFDAGDGPVKGYVAPHFGTSEILFSTTNTLWSILDNGGGAALKWSLATIPNPSTPLALNLAGTPYAWVGSSGGRLYQLDISGALPALTSVTLGDGSATVGGLALDTILEIGYVGTEEGRLYSINLPLP